VEISQESSLCSYLKQTKMPFSSFIKLENRKVLPGGVGTNGRGGGGERV
jgi:hypothetical protein